MKLYFLHWPGMVYAINVYGNSKRDAITRFKKEGFKKENYIKRMPNGYAIWEAQAFLWEGTGIKAICSFREFPMAKLDN